MNVYSASLLVAGLLAFASSAESANFKLQPPKQQEEAIKEIHVQFYTADKKTTPADARRIGISDNDVVIVAVNTNPATKYACLTFVLKDTWKIDPVEGRYLFQIPPQRGSLTFNKIGMRLIAKGTDPVMCFNIRNISIHPLVLARRDFDRTTASIGFEFINPHSYKRIATATDELIADIKVCNAPQCDTEEQFEIDE